MNLTTFFRLRKPEGTDPVNVEDFNDNFDVIDTELSKRPEKTGNASDMVTTFTQASSRANLTPGEKLSVSFGKIMKFFADLKSVAFTGNYADLSGLPTIPSGAAASQAVANNCTTTAAGSVLDARQGKVLMDKANQISSDLSGRLPNSVKIISEGSGANVKYYAQLGADTASKKPLGRPQKYSYSNCLQGFKSENPAAMADSPVSSCMVVYITNVPGYDSLTLDNLIIVTDFVSHESEGGCTYGYVYNAAVGRITIYPTSSNRFKRGNSGAATVYVMP